MPNNQSSKPLSRSLTTTGFAFITAVALSASIALPTTVDAQLTKQEGKCIGKLTKDGGKVSKSVSKLQQKCMKDAAAGKLSGTADVCIATDEKGKVAKDQAKTLTDETKLCFDGTGFMNATGAQTNLSSSAQTQELGRDLLGTTLDAAVQIEKANIKCQQKVQKALDKVLAAKIKAYTKCSKLAAKDPLTTNLAPFENCLLGLPTDSKVIKAIEKLNSARVKSCDSLPLETIFPGSCNLVDPVQFDACADAIAECRACTVIAGMNGLATDCDIFDNGLADLSCASAAPVCGDGNIDLGEECDPGAEPTCCSSTCVNNSDGLACDDGTFCNGAETCSSGACVSPGDPCIGGAECNVTCNEGTDDCFDPGATGCTDDGNECTDDFCDGAGNCTHPNNTDPCDDGLFCTVTDTCDGGGTCVGVGDPCIGPDGDGDCAESCDDVADNCLGPDPAASACDDGLFCTATDTCDGGGTCVGVGDPCSGGAECNVTCNEGAGNCFDSGGTACTDDGNVCTNDECDGGGTCAHPNNTDPCDDGSVCTTVDTCGGGTCNGSVPLDCSDGNICTEDVCNAISGCSNPNNTAPCDDGFFCNGADTCSGGSCLVHAGDPCAGGSECNDSCNEGPDNCFDAAATPCTDDGNVCSNDTCDGAGACAHPPNTASCDDGLFCNGTDTCAAGSCSVHTGDPCTGPDGDDNCSESCDEGVDNCLGPDPNGTACDNGVVGPNDNCDVTGDTCSSGACVNSDPAQVPEQCYTVGDEDCDGFADSADTDADSQCQANGIQTCTCADACEVGRVVPAASGASSLDGLTALSGEGSVSTSISSAANVGTNTGTSYTHTLSGVPANLSLWLGFTSNSGHGGPISQFRFAASDSNAQGIGDNVNEGPATNGGTGSALTEPSRTDGLPITVNIGCSASTATSLEIQRTGGPGTNWTAWGVPFPTSALTAALQTEQSTYLTNTRLMPVTGNGALVTRLRLQLGGSAMDTAYDACHTPLAGAGGFGYGVNMTAAIYGSYRDANVCP